MSELNITLTKKVDYELKPFGRFAFKWNPSKAIAQRPHIIPVGELSFSCDAAMPQTDEQYKTISKFMVKHKTEILIDSRGDYYSVAGGGLNKVSHPKLNSYSSFLKQRDYEDPNSKEAWDDYKN